MEGKVHNAQGIHVLDKVFLKFDTFFRKIGVYFEIFYLTPRLTRDKINHLVNVAKKHDPHLSLFLKALIESQAT